MKTELILSGIIGIGGMFAVILLLCCAPSRKNRIRFKVQDDWIECRYYDRERCGATASSCSDGHEYECVTNYEVLN